MNRPSDTLLASWVEETVREVQRRQSELHDVEAKRAQKDLPKRLYRTFSAFGNREGGGIILLGLDETKRFTVSGVDDVARTQRDLLNFVQTEMSYPLRLETTVADVDGQQVVAVTVMEAPFTQKPVYYRPLGLDKGSYCRSGISNVQMTVQQIRQILAAQVEGREDFSARLISTLPDDWIDLLEVERLRQILQAARRGSELDTLPTDELLLKLQLTEPTGNRNVPTVAGLLLVGKEAHLRQHVVEHEVVFLRYPTDMEEYESRSDLKRPLLSVIESIQSSLEATNRIVPIQVGLFRYEIPYLNSKVYREALLNAIIHRNYADYGSVFVRLYPQRLEISNPGGFLPGISADNLLTGTPKHRNRRLAEAFQLLGLVERAGMGVRRMYRHQLENGKQPPAFTGGESHVHVSIPTAQIDEKMAGFVGSRYRSGYRFDVGDLQVLNQLRSVREVRTQEVADLTQRTHHAAASLLNGMVSKDLLRRRGVGRGTVYTYSPALNRALGNAPRAARDTNIESVRHPQMIAQYIKEQGRITNRDCQILCDLTQWQASKLLRKLVDNGMLERRGQSLKLTYYVLVASDPSAAP